MKQFGFMLIVFLMVLPFGNYTGADSGESFSLLEPSPTAGSAIQDKINSVVEEAVFFSVNSEAFQQILAQRRPSIIVEFPLHPDGGRLILQRADILSPNSRVVEGTTVGDRDIDFRNKFISYHGVVENLPGSLVSLTLSPLGVMGLVSDGDESFVLASLKNEAGAGSGAHVFYDASKIKAQQEFTCGTEFMEIPERIQNTMQSLQQSVPDILTSDVLEVEIAVESDYDTYSQFGSSVTDASSFLLSLMSAVSAVYTRDLNVKLTVPYLRVWSTPSDPYEGIESSTLLTQFRNYWNNNMQSVQRDLAHYIAIRPGGLGGIAWVDVLCSNSGSAYGYAFSDINGSFSGLPVYSWDVSVVAHETGHNFGSPHTHNCFWPGGPIDTCHVSSENDFCVSVPAPREGTIMSYCHLLATVALEFHPLPISLMRQNAEQASCVGIVSQPLSLLTPNGGEVFPTRSEVYIVWGANFGGTVNLQYSLDNGLVWTDIAGGVLAEKREYRWSVPYVPTSNQALLKIFDPANPGVEDVSDAPFTIKTVLWGFDNLSPATFSTIGVGPGDPTPVDFSWNAAGTVPGISYKLRLFSLSNQRVKIPSNNSGNDSTVTLTAHQIDSILTSWNSWAAEDSVRIRWTARAYLEADSAQANPIQYVFFKRNSTSLENNSDNLLPATTVLHQNFPNPFNPETLIQFTLAGSEEIALTVYNPLGQSVRKIMAGNRQAGLHEVRWDGRNDLGQALPSGIYLLRLNAGTFSATRKLFLLK